MSLTFVKYKYLFVMSLRKLKQLDKKLSSQSQTTKYMHKKIQKMPIKIKCFVYSINCKKVRNVNIFTKLIYFLVIN